jgi:hypothetical protein
MNLFNNSNKMTAEKYDELWGTIEEKLEDMYTNKPDSYDLDDYELMLNGNEILIEYIQMGYDHHNSARKLLEILLEEGIIKIK